MVEIAIIGGTGILSLYDAKIMGSMFDNCYLNSHFNQSIDYFDQNGGLAAVMPPYE